MLWKTLKRHLNTSYRPGEWPEVYTVHQSSLTYPIRYKGCKEISQIRLWGVYTEHPTRHELYSDEEVSLTKQEAVAMANLLNGNLYFVESTNVDGEQFYAPFSFSADRPEFSFDTGSEDSFYESYADALSTANAKNGFFK